MTTFRQLPCAVALAAFALFAAPGHAQGLGGLLNKASQVGQTVKQQLPSPKTADAAPNRPAEAGSEASASGHRANPLDAEKQLSAALRTLVPKDTKLLVVRCQASATGMSYENVYLYGATPATLQTGQLAAIPPAVQARFVALREAMQGDEGNHRWDVCRVNMAFGQKETFGDENAGRFAYGYDRDRANGGDEQAYKPVPTPAALLARARSANTQLTRERQGAAAEAAKLKREHDAYIAAGGHDRPHWQCTYCSIGLFSDTPPSPTYSNCGGNHLGPHNWVQK